MREFGAVFRGQCLRVIALRTALTEHCWRARCPSRERITHNPSNQQRSVLVKRQTPFVVLGELFDRPQHITATDLTNQAAPFNNRQAPTPTAQEAL